MPNIKEEAAKAEQAVAEAAAADQAPAAEETPDKENKKEKKPKKQRKEGVLLNVLTILLLIVGIAEIGLIALTGFSFYRGMLAQRAYQAQLEAGSESAAPVTGVVSYAGPWLTVENGTVVWRSDKSPFGGGIGVNVVGLDSTEGDAQTPTEYPRTPASPPRSWVWTIDSDRT